MPKITVKDGETGETYEVEDGKRLVLALEDNGVDILHRCGGYAKCTTCRVEFAEGEPDKMTAAERDKLQEQDNLGKFRLSCQIPCDHDMTVAPLMTLSNTDMDDAGGRPEDQITPEPEWVDVPQA